MQEEWVSSAQGCHLAEGVMPGSVTTGKGTLSPSQLSWAFEMILCDRLEIHRNLFISCKPLKNSLF